jgi:hypothetical protein
MTMDFTNTHRRNLNVRELWICEKYLFPIEVQSESKLLSVSSWPINGRTDNNLKSFCILFW